MPSERAARGLVSHATVEIAAPAAAVWKGLTDPAIIKRYMFGADVACDWHEGSPWILRGEWKGTPFEDKGVVLRAEPNRLLEYTHYSPGSGAPDVPESYHTITIRLTERGERTGVELAQDNNASDEARDDADATWATMLGTLKDVLEGT